MRVLQRFFLISWCFLFIAMPAQATVVIGNPHGHIVLTEFFDYQCPHCREIAPILNQIKQRNPNVKVELRVIPVIASNSWFIAKAALAARSQGKFGPFHQLLVAQRSQLTKETVMSLAKQAGLNIAQLNAKMKDPALTRELKANIRASRHAGVTAVPTLIIRSRGSSSAKFRYDGNFTLNTIQSNIETLKR